MVEIHESFTRTLRVSGLSKSYGRRPALEDVTVAIHRPTCAEVAPASSVLTASFHRVMGAGDVSIWVRNKP